MKGQTITDMRRGGNFLRWVGGRIGTAAAMVVLGWMNVGAQESGASDDPIQITGTAETDRIPIALEGFRSQIRDILRFDLAVVGFEVSSPRQADYRLEGIAGEGVGGRLYDQISKEMLFGKEMVEGDLRARAHALADAVVSEVTGQPPIARTRIAFTLSRGRHSELYVSDYDGHNPVQLTEDRSLVTAPAWVPGELILYYTSYRRENPDIYVHNLESGKRRVIARYLGLNTSPAVSPDGQRLAMILSKDGSPDVFVGDRNGDNLQRLTYTRADESAPIWSPDGEQLCFVSRARGRAELYWIAPTGGEMHRIKTVGVYTATEPAWSPDGKWIAFTTLRGGEFELCAIPANGGKGGDVIDLGVLGEDPSWAPNSRTVVFTRQGGNAGGSLALLDIPTRTVKPLHRSVSGEYGEPVWAQ